MASASGRSLEVRLVVLCLLALALIERVVREESFQRYLQRRAIREHAGDNKPQYADFLDLSTNASPCTRIVGPYAQRLRPILQLYTLS
jgi:hypothetical protein